MPELALAGCTPEPLMNYLKALGVFRLLAEQVDPAARLSWLGGVAHLESRFLRDGISAFFLEHYRPTAIAAPWNGGSGFYGGGAEPLERIAQSTNDRLGLYRDTIARIRTFRPDSKPRDEQKEALLVECRAELADEIVPWLDVCFVLGEEGPSYFPLLGTGGNDGRLDFTNNFMQRLAEVLPLARDEKPSGESWCWLAAALFADTLVKVGKSAIGQFNPGGVGGPNGTQGNFEADSQVNPWDFVLMIEGTLLFAGSIGRRLGAHRAGRSVFPFCVDSVAVGYGSATASEETPDGSRSELWLPLWNQPVTLSELRHLFAEGRAQLGRRQARNAVEFALAVNLLGVDRGVTSFTRYGFLKRNGLSFLGAPLGRVGVSIRPQARLLDEPPLTEWIGRLRAACRDKDKTPMRYQSALRRIDRAVFAFSTRSEHGSDAIYLLDVLRSLGQAEQSLATGLAFAKGKYLRPLQGLGPQWLEQANDGSPEFRLAASLAGIRSRGAVGPLRMFLEEVEETRFVKWSPGQRSAVWTRRPLAGNLAAIFRRRLMEAFRNTQRGVPLSSPFPARVGDVLHFLHDEIDEAKLAELLWALTAIDWSAVDPQVADAHELAVPVEFGVPRLLVEPRTFIAARGHWVLASGALVNAQPDPDVFHILASGRRNAVRECVERAARRLKSGGLLVTGYRNRSLVGRPLGIVSPIRAERLLAAMLFPLAGRDLAAIADAVLYPPEIEE